MARIPTIAEEDAKRPNRERECLVRERTPWLSKPAAMASGWRVGLRHAGSRRM